MKDEQIKGRRRRLTFSLREIRDMIVELSGCWAPDDMIPKEAKISLCIEERRVCIRLEYKD